MHAWHIPCTMTKSCMEPFYCSLTLGTISKFVHGAVTTDDNISSYLAEAEMTVHVMWHVCINSLYKLDFFSFLILASDFKIQYRFHSVF